MFHHPLLGVAGATAVQLFGLVPVGGGILAVEDSRGGEVDGPGADAGGPGGGGMYLAQPLHYPLVGFLVEQGAADDHDVWRYHLVETGRRAGPSGQRGTSCLTRKCQEGYLSEGIGTHLLSLGRLPQRQVRGPGWTTELDPCSACFTTRVRWRSLYV
jgi:hypothetical protein